MKLSRDFREFIESLNANDVRYLVVGGYAVALHGYPRLTKDLDIWLWLEAENAARVVNALADFGFASLGLRVEDFLVPDQIIQLGYPPNRIDLITTLPGVDFDTCFDQRDVVMLGDVSVNFIDRENLKRNKQASGRLQDLADLENLE
ncbi:MAG: hypothetical protein H6649_15385 [Caldilineae bacterium]|nr:hypothetical protein [Anaerolineae bacterium]MCB9155426.1 hypothetical protein [Caldilineae bacterium]